MPPNTWSPKRERQYEAIKESELSRGRTPAKAKEIAARTVNKQRRESGETENKTSMGTGNPRKPFEAGDLQPGEARRCQRSHLDEEGGARSRATARRVTRERYGAALLGHSSSNTSSMAPGACAASQLAGQSSRRSGKLLPSTV